MMWLLMIAACVVGGVGGASAALLTNNDDLGVPIGRLILVSVVFGLIWPLTIVEEVLFRLRSRAGD